MGTNLHTLRAWAEVDLDALRHNVQFVRRTVGPQVKILCSVKADAYGHGLPQIAGILMQAGVDFFGVANAAEALTIRARGRGWNILLLSAALPSEVGMIVTNRFSPSLSSLEEARAFDDEAARQGITLPVHVVIDTGMRRLGFWHASAPEQIARLGQFRHLELRGIYTHYASADCDAAFTARQHRDFLAALDALKARGVSFPLIHAANSAGLLRGPSHHFQLVRPGIMIYGDSPLARFQSELRPALSLKARVTFVKDVGKGQSISYGATCTASRKLRVATVAIGYGDGYPRAASNRAFVLAGGQRCKLLGRVTMDQIMIDVSRLPQIAPGDEVVLIGEQGGKRILPSELARWSDTISYEIFTGITKRVPRIYRGTTAA
ncbi:alanine racemase [Kamptonema cortianum]|nr:alanine racemase [Oscillatoria laete-virens]MDK3157997.1 alanine racemase [Kamptonema cortianum]MDL5053125.1 alanine racemase [Oscillatoria laete-virens NRMC-F 0139]